MYTKYYYQVVGHPTKTGDTLSHLQIGTYFLFTPLFGEAKPKSKSFLLRFDRSQRCLKDQEELPWEAWEPTNLK